MNGVRMPRADFITALVLLAFGAAMLWGALAMPRFEQRAINPYSIPGIVPGILAGVNIILAAVLLVRSIIRGGYRLGGGGFRHLLGDPATARLGLAFVLCLIYAVGLVGVIPFWLATAGFVTAFVVLFEWTMVAPDRRWLMVLLALLLGGVIAVAVTLVFQELFLVTLP